METRLTPTALIYDPYLDTLGGGERYTLSLAQVLLERGYTVCLAWPNDKIISQAKTRFNLSLDGLTTSYEHYQLLSQASSLLNRRQTLKDFDLVFFVSDGSVPVLFGRNNILHYQVPFTKINRFNFLNQLKLTSINHLVVNSLFTKHVIDRTLNTSKSTVIYPPIDTKLFASGRKQKLILNVGRFASPSHSKRQDVLVTAFKTLCDSGLRGYRLILAGGQFGQDTVLDELRRQARGYPIEFIVSPPFSKLKQLYAASTLYWHAAGFEVDETLNPESVEHFGITTVEAMASGCVPLVVAKGGQKEIITPKTGFLWQTTAELIDQTKKILKTPRLLATMSKHALLRAQDFSYDNFKTKFINLL